MESHHDSFLPGGGSSQFSSSISSSQDLDSQASSMTLQNGQQFPPTQDFLSSQADPTGDMDMRKSFSESEDFGSSQVDQQLADIEVIDLSSEESITKMTVVSRLDRKGGDRASNLTRAELMERLYEESCIDSPGDIVAGGFMNGGANYVITCANP